MTDSLPLPLVIRDLGFRYNSRTTPAIEDINLHLEPGQIVLLAGSSGCGKTTLMRCVNGLIPHTYQGYMQGEIELYGKSIKGMGLAEISKHVGTLLQDPERQILGTYVINEVCFGLESQGMPREEMIQKAEKALERLHITHLKDKETHYTSGGEKQKVALAGVLAMEPNILLLDEPLASLDPASAREALLAFRELADEGLSILLVEHRVEDVLEINPEKVIYMDNGRVVYQGDVKGLLETADYTRIKLPAQTVMRRAKGKPFEECCFAVPAFDPQSEPLVSFQDVCFRYKEDGPEVLHGINLDIRAGEVIAILGHNGSGKTTTVKQALGLLKPTSGQVLLEGVETRKTTVANVAKTIGYVFQSPSQMLFAPTVREELAFGPENLGMDKETVSQNVDWAIETVHLEHELPMPPLALSFGQQKRVSIASVLSMKSRILMMDEPTSGQDYWNYQSFMNTILQTPGFDAILFITHDLDLALTYANRVVVLYGGQVMADGSPYEVFADDEQLRQWRLLPTSLLKLNREMYAQTGQFLRAEALSQLAG
ncbi:MAG: energy-coupling factor ABC transporter ATP-binding protein [Anaerolineaceae bacterium]|mgnify:CR=1 FL=1|jgi:energy-coupling factor transport system ATP-binding protein|nr:energy-coupling factor ABC transporter ATP-binding protein [Anaerolineaceae bacterium]NLE92686.1 energy-coupling factor ABC transporter ATP-binding protein [Chloroflexota bacterium]